MDLIDEKNKIDNIKKNWIITTSANRCKSCGRSLKDSVEIRGSSFRGCKCGWVIKV